MLAYALFKQAVREDVARGVETIGNSRNPSPTVITAYRQAAERRLEELISANIENATPEIQQSATLAAISTLEANLKGHVTAKTGMVHAIFSNFIAWVITLAATVLILSVAGRPDAEETLADTARALGQQQPRTPTTLPPELPTEKAVP